MNNRSFLITGAGSGFGRATALKLASDGARLALGDVNLATATETAELARKAGGEALAVALDVTQERTPGRGIQQRRRARTDRADG